MKLHYAAALVVLGLAAGSAKAAFNLLDDFNSYSTGADVSLGGVGGWSTAGNDAATAGEATIQLDPTGGSGKVLELFDTGGNMSVYQKSASITMPTGTTPATVFFRVRCAQDSLLHEAAAGMTDQAAPASFSDGRSWLLLGNDGDGTPGPTEVSAGVYNATATNDPLARGYLRPFNVPEDTWFKVWEVFHNDGSGVTGGTYDVYIEGGTFTSPTPVATGSYFRDTNSLGATGALTTFAMLSDDLGLNFFDDIYVDTGSANLNDPTASGVPEPATIGLLGLSVIGLIGRRRTRN